MPELVLGPILRHVDETQATIWVETDAPCTVEILGHQSRTFQIDGHFFAIVHVKDLEPASTSQYTVTLDGEQHWPQPRSEFPPSVIRTTEPGGPARIAFGSCRLTVGHGKPYTLPKDEDERGREVDALRALALRLAEQEHDQWPTRLLMLGDQVYADEVSPETRRFIESRRDTSQPPGEEIADFEEYTRLYREAWSEPVIRWLLSTVPTSMIFDDHDVHDDWNVSESWVSDMRAKDWWPERIAGAFMSYWIYQHLGNLPPDSLEKDEIYERVCDADDGAATLREFALYCDRETDGSQWSYCRDHGATRLIVIDSRAGRILKDGRRCMVDEEEWAWVCERLTGGHDHLIIASSLPVLLGQGMHYAEAWSEAVCNGAWGKAGAWAGEKLRRAADFEHWAAFDESFDRLMRRIEEVGAGKHGPPPASITILSGDVHHAYLTQVGFRRDAGVKSAVWQAVCSPLRNPLGRKERWAIRFGASRTGHALGRALARAAGVADPEVRWRMVEGPYFDNQVATLVFDGANAQMTLERTEPGASEDERPQLVECFSQRLT